MNEQVTDEIKVTPEMIDACRNVLEKWGAFEWGRPLPDDSLISDDSILDKPQVVYTSA